jgi:hypothetical protein
MCNRIRKSRSTYVEKKVDLNKYRTELRIDFHSQAYQKTDKMVHQHVNQKKDQIVHHQKLSLQAQMRGWVSDKILR